MRLLPREEKFYHLFARQVEIISEAGRLLLEGVTLGNSRLAGAATEITVLEHKGDEVIHEVFRRLNQTFITPIDPEDIQDRKSTRLNSSHMSISYAVFCLKKKKTTKAKYTQY